MNLALLVKVSELKNVHPNRIWDAANDVLANESAWWTPF